MPFSRPGRPTPASLRHPHPHGGVEGKWPTIFPEWWAWGTGVVAAVVALLLTACGGGSSLLLPGDGLANHIKIETGNNQSGRVGEPLTDPLVAQVTDSRGRPVQGVSVAFAFTSGAPGAEINPPTATTDAKGEAIAQVVLGTTIGPQTGEASIVTDGGSAPSTSFTVMAVPKDANGIAVASGDDQTGAAGSKLRQPLVVQVTDAFGNPSSGVRIDWSAGGGGGVSDAFNTTDANGLASVERTLGPTAGKQTTAASSGGLAGSPVTFNHTATAGNASGLSIVSGNNQTATAGTRLPADLVVRLVDGEGNGVPGTAVTWVVGTGGGSVTPQNGTTDDQGRASAQWTLGPNPGENRVDAVVSGIGIANFKATGTAGAPAALAIVTQPSGSAQNGVPFRRQPMVQVRDAQGHNVTTSGILVTAQLSGSGGELTGTRQRPTDGSGRASFTDLAISGATGRRTLVFTASGYAGATSDPIEVSPIGTTTTITNDAPDPSLAGSSFPVEFRVTSAGPVPTGTVTVTVSDGSANCSGTLQNGVGSCQLTLGKAGERTLKATYLGGPGLNGSSDTETHRVTQPPPQNQPPHADYNWHCDGFTCSFTDNSRDSDGNVVSWDWRFGDGGSSQDRNPVHTFPGAGTYQVALTVTDNSGATDAKTAAVPVNAPPPAGTTTTITSDNPDPSDPTVPITVSFTVTSPSGTPTGTVQVTDPNGGGCTGSAPSGSCSYTPNGLGSRTITATYQGTSGFSGSSDGEEHTVTTPPPPNQAPVAQGDAYTTNEDTPLTITAPGVLANDHDPEGGPLSAVNPSTPAHGTLALNPDGSFVYTPAASFNGIDSFTYQASDGSLLSGPATVTITVTHVNHAPVAQADAYTTAPDTPLDVPIPGVLANDSDPDGDPMTVSVTLGGDPLNGILSLNPNGSFTYTPNAGFIGMDSFTYSASDGSLASSATASIGVTAPSGIRTQR